MKRIIAWVEKEGVEGFLSFEQNELKLSLTDPKDEKKDDKKRPRAPSLEAAEKKVEKKKDAPKKNVPTRCKDLN